jgi:RNA:NAD 2'-phosphotransferase (TPT1/KptA family)
MVEHDEKCRYALSADTRFIRATQGHTIQGLDLGMHQITSADDPALDGASVLLHATNLMAWCQSIRHEGLKPMNRSDVHFAIMDRDPGGVLQYTKFRDSADVAVWVNIQRMLRDGVPLQVLAMLWLSQGIGHITTRSRGKLLRSRSDKFRYGGEYVYSGGKKSRGLVGWRRVTEE